MHKASEELSSKLADLVEEDISTAIDNLRIPSEIFEKEAFISTQQADTELKEMFNNIVLQFIEPVRNSIQSLAANAIKPESTPNKVEFIKRSIDACIGALTPLINAAITIRYHDVYDVLKSIERPLLNLQQGDRKIPTDREIKNLTRDFNELERLIHQNLGNEYSTIVESLSDGNNLPANVISEAMQYYQEIDNIYIQKLYAAGITHLNDLVSASAEEISQATNIPQNIAEQIKQCTARALIDLSIPIRDGKTSILNSIDNVSTMQSNSSSNILTDNEQTRSKPFDFLPEDLILPGEIERMAKTLKTIQQQINDYGKAATNLNEELTQTHRALLRLHLERENLYREIEFHKDDIRQFFEQNNLTSEESAQTTTNIHNTMSRSLRQVMQSILSAMKKTNIVYTQMENSIREIQDLENEIIELRRKRKLKSSRTKE